MGFFNKKRTDGATYDGQGEVRRGFIDVVQQPFYWCTTHC